MDLDSPVELLLEHGALFTFRVAGAPNIALGRVQAFPADLLLENGQRLMFNSAELAPVAPPLFRSFFLSLSLSLFSLFFSLFLKMSLHRFEAVGAGGGAAAGNWASGSEPGTETSSESGRGFGSGGSDGLLRVGTRRRGRITPSTKSSSAETRLGFGNEGFWTLQNSNSGELESVVVVRLLLPLPLVLGERVLGCWGLNLRLSSIGDREKQVVWEPRSRVWSGKEGRVSEFQRS